MISPLVNNTKFSSFNLIAPQIGAIAKTSEKKDISQESKKNKMSAFVGSLVGTGLSTVFIIKSQKTQQSLFKKVMDANFATSKNLLTVGISSIIGGFVGRIIEDKNKNVWKKVKEMNFQVLSNVVFPVLFLNIFKKTGGKLTKNSTKMVKNITNFASVFGGVGVGAFLGASLANIINNKIMKPDVSHKRKLGVKDFLVHVDDLPVAFAMTNIPYIDKLIPLVLISRGYEVGKQ